jgi:glycerophosphoryl diester phosphodiesterase
MPHTPLRIGHRGAAGHAPENTLLSVAKALELGVDLVEIDVQRTSDGKLVVLHDKRVDRTTTNGKGYLANMTLEEVRSLDIEPDQKIPTLEEILSAINGRSGIMIELIEEGISNQVVECVRASGFIGQVIYASFLHSEMLAIHEIDASLRTLALLEGIPVDHTSFAREAKVTHVGLAFDSTRSKFIQDLHESGHKVFVYTLNDLADIEQAIRWGVDGIISNYPERIPVNGSKAAR